MARSKLPAWQARSPTPAIGGYPSDAALAAIRDRDGFDRGWYAAPVGWLDHKGEGEFAVAIRSALLRRSGQEGDALLFAGCGIVADSDPVSEYAESQLKLLVMLSSLTPDS
jgi:menaquinone-specific isochorismate synthase